MTPLALAALNANLPMVERLLDAAAGADINQHNSRLEPALHGAADRGANKVVTFLVHTTPAST